MRSIIFLLPMWCIVFIAGIQLCKRLTLPYANGRYFDADTGIVLHEQANVVYAVIWVLAVILVVLGTLFITKKRPERC